jgi:hypothetical protein
MSRGRQANYIPSNYVPSKAVPCKASTPSRMRTSDRPKPSRNKVPLTHAHMLPCHALSAPQASGLEFLLSDPEQVGTLFLPVDDAFDSFLLAQGLKDPQELLAQPNFLSRYGPTLGSC